MTSSERFDRTVADWLHEDARHHVPEHLSEILGQTVRTRQRPWWASRERWLPVQTTLRFAPVPRVAWLLVVLAILVATGVAVLAVGSQRALPAPFGLARNGAIVASRDGDIYAIDSSTSAASILIGGDDYDFGPYYSRDGSRFMFLRSASVPAEPAMLKLMVADADGSELRELTPAVPSLDWFEWSPDGLQIAYISRVNGDGVITVVNADGSGSTTLDVGRPAHFVAWRPPDGRELIFRGEQLSAGDPAPGIFAVHPDGTGLRELSTVPANNEFDYQNPAVAPDGAHVAFTRWDSAGNPSAYVLDLKAGTERRLPTPIGSGQRGGVFSPDGKLMAASRVYRHGMFELVVVPADGSTEGIALGPRLPATPDGGNIEAYYAFTPDGSAVIAAYPDSTSRRLPVDGSAGTILNEGAFNFVDVQRLAP